MAVVLVIQSCTKIIKENRLILPINSIPISEIKEPFLKKNSISLQLLRLEQTDQFISGNKWFKLLYNLEKFKKEHYTVLLTFGGAYSNHIHATAEACHRFNIPAIGIIRGEKPEKLNQTLTQALERNMQLYFVSRNDYRQKQHPEFIKQLITKLINKNYITQQDKIYVLPEGGSNELAIKGCALIPKLITSQYHYLCCAIGSGGTFGGLIHGVEDNNTKLLGFSALKGADQLENSIIQLIKEVNVTNTTPSWQINHDYHFGGFAKTKPELFHFINVFYQNHKIKLDVIYTGKMMYGLYQLIKNDYFPKNTNIVAIHTGGLQGNHEFEKKGFLKWQ
ncbi:MAG: pyridoxal-phosphate dependent enzyme [Gammaproteobacteria bacterium]|nr:pyridoxal-phosphate dependent enzyme [Gammaproteobacteria bacterium]